MNVAVTRMHAWTAAGLGVERLVDALVAGVPLARETPGLPTPIAALTDAPDVDTLLGEVVAAVLPGGVRRVGLVVGTTSGTISDSFDAWMRKGAPAEEERAWRSEPARRCARRLRLAPVTTVSVACASSTVAFEIGAAWLRAGRCDAVVVAGVEKHGTYIHAGFAGLGALGPRGARPFAPDRDGLLLGEGAAAFLLEPEGATSGPPLAWLLGAATAQDAHHLTAPDPSGAGLAAAARAALAKAGLPPDAVDAVSAHGTGTLLNDAAEAAALTHVFGGAPVPLHGVKAVVGHCLGAAGAVEAAVCIAALGGAALPAPPETPLLRVRAPGRVATALSVNAAFGGLNAAVVFGAPSSGSTTTAAGANPAAAEAGPASSAAARRGEGAPLPDPAPGRRLAAVRARRLPLDRVWPGAPPALGRADRYVRAGVRLCREIAHALSPDDLLVLTSAADCRAADHRYYAGILARGPAGASRLHFPYTIPGAPLAEGSIAAGLHHAAWVLCGELSPAEAEVLRVGSGARRLVHLRVEAPSDDPGRYAVGEATVYGAGGVGPGAAARGGGAGGEEERGGDEAHAASK